MLDQILRLLRQAFFFLAIINLINLIQKLSIEKFFIDLSLLLIFKDQIRSNFDLI